MHVPCMLLNAFECFYHSFELEMMCHSRAYLQCQHRTSVQVLRGSAALEMKLKNNKKKTSV